MYESSFGLSDRPFVAAPAAARYFPAAAIEAARQTIARCIDRAEGTSLLVGPAGSGKSILCQVLAEQFRDQFLVALLASGRLDSRRSLLQAILFELGLQYRGMDEGELRLSLVDYLTSQETKGGLLLIGDEAHRMPMRLIEEIHLLTNLVCDGRPRVRVVLAGSPVLEEHLGNSKLESFSQRIAARCYLLSFQHAETLGYIRQAISHAGGTPDQIFTSDAFDAIHRLTDGVPRLVNQLCDHALLLACAAGMKPLSSAGIEEAWADLQQLPTRWNAAPGVESPRADIIEFGSLDDSDATVRMASAVEPRLHTIAADEETLFTGEPVQRIERIKDRLGSIDEQFQPAATIGPEVELVFSTAEVNPFQESFEEEELVVDPFAGSRSSLLSKAPVVRSEEGFEIASALTSHSRTKPVHPKQKSDASTDISAELPNGSSEPAGQKGLPSRNDSAPSIVHQDFLPIIASIDQPLQIAAIDEQEACRSSPSSASDETNDATWPNPPEYELPGGMLPIGTGWIHPSEDPVMPEEAPAKIERSASSIQPTIPMPRHPLPIGPAAKIRSVGGAHGKNPLEAKSPDQSQIRPENVADDLTATRSKKDDLNEVDPNDADMIIVEEDPVPPPPKQTSVRRQEYRQLFARLRRG